MSDTVYCTYRWDSGSANIVGYCQCQRWSNHQGPHRCCCEREYSESQTGLGFDYCIRCGAPHPADRKCLRDNPIPPKTAGKMGESALADDKVKHIETPEESEPTP